MRRWITNTALYCILYARSLFQKIFWQFVLKQEPFHPCWRRPKLCAYLKRKIPAWQVIITQFPFSPLFSKVFEKIVRQRAEGFLERFHYYYFHFNIILLSLVTCCRGTVLVGSRVDVVYWESSCGRWACCVLYSNTARPWDLQRAVTSRHVRTHCHSDCGLTQHTADCYHHCSLQPCLYRKTELFRRLKGEIHIQTRDHEVWTDPDPQNTFSVVVQNLCIHGVHFKRAFNRNSKTIPFIVIFTRGKTSPWFFTQMQKYEIRFSPYGGQL